MVLMVEEILFQSLIISPSTSFFFFFFFFFPGFFVNSGVSLHEQKIPDNGFLALYPFSQFMKVTYFAFF